MSEDPITLCPICGKTLVGVKCKMVCPDPLCNYYLSCSDFL